MLTFQRWMQDVDDLCIREFLLSIYDLPDMPFYDSYKSEMTPEEFMAEAIPDLDALRQLVLS